MRIEPASIDDVDRLVEAWAALAADQRQYGSHILPGENRARIQRLFASHAVDGTALVALEDDDVVGFVTFEVERNGFERSVRRGVVQNVFVEEAARDAGVGSALIEAAEAALAERGAEVVVLEVMADNDAARRLYRRLGYRPHRIEYEKLQIGAEGT